jgi:hypothetical protein
VGLVYNFPLLTVVPCLLSAVVCSMVSGRVARYITTAVLALISAFSAVVMISCLADGASFTYALGFVGAPWGNELRAGALEGLLGFAAGLVLCMAVLGGVRFIQRDVTAQKENLYYLLVNLLGAAVMALGLLGMYFSRTGRKIADLLLFGIFGFVMIVGYIFISALAGSIVRDNTPTDQVGRLQGVRMVFSVLLPMLIGPMIGNAINVSRNIPLLDASSPDAMTTLFIPAPEIYLAAAGFLVLVFAVIPLLVRCCARKTTDQSI